MRFNIRMINLGCVEKTGTVEAPDILSAYNEAHPELMDPLVQCARGGPVRWIEVQPIQETAG